MSPPFPTPPDLSGEDTPAAGDGQPSPHRRTGGATAPVGIVAALPEEVEVILDRLEAAQPVALPEPGEALPVTRRGRLAGAPVAVAVTGDGERNARRGVESFLSALPVRGLLAVGAAAGLAPAMEPGSLVVAREVRRGQEERLTPDRDAVERAARSAGARTGVVVTVPELLDSPEAKAAVRDAVAGDEASPPPAVADLESAFYASAARAAGIPWLVLRAVSDGASESLPSFLNHCRDEGGAVRRSRVVRHAFVHPGVLPDLVRLRRRVQSCAERVADAAERILAAERPSEARPA